MSDRRNSIRIDGIELIRAPGLPRSFELTGFTPGINVVWGPNGSGKSTTARAINSLFWPDRQDDSVQFEAKLEYDGASWLIKREGRRASALKAGQDHAPLTFAHLTRETRNRYFLALHDLLQADDGAFAADIAREMSGGYDLEAAARVTGFENDPSPSGLVRSLGNAEQEHRKALAEQGAVAQEQARLSELNAISAKVSAANVRLDALKLVRDAIEQAQHRDVAVEQLAGFDPALAFAKGFDAERIAAWQKDEPNLRSDREEIERERAELVARRAELRLPDVATANRIIQTAGTYLNELRESERRLKAAEQELATAKSNAIRLNGEIGPFIPDDLRIEETVKLINQFADALDRLDAAERTGAAEAIVARHIDRPDELPALRPIEQRFESLVRWLQTSPPAMVPPIPDSIRWLAIVAGLVIAAEAVLLGYYWHAYAYGLGVIGLAVITLALRIQGPPAEPDPRIEIANEYARLHTPALREWTAEEAAVELMATIEELRDAEVGLLREQVWKALDHHLADRERLLTESHESVAALEAKLGTNVTVDRPALRLLADTLNTANTAWHQVANSEARLDQCRQDAATTLDAVIKAIAPVMQIEPTDLASAAAELEAIKQRCARLTETENRLAELRQSLDLRVNPSLERIERDRAEMIERYEGRGIEEIEDLIRQYPAWLDARDAVQRRQEQFDIAANRLTHGYELDAWPIERVQAEINECRQIGERATDTNQEIGRIENKIEQAKRSDKIATAWNRVLELREALLTRRNEQMLKSVGRLILDDVRRETRDANLPLVARRARELFTLFTHGRYELRTNPGPSPKFSAFDTQLRIEQSLDQLSSATRVQLLIAVRMAFVETQESDVLLPMIFDETLANADSLRADALINTTLEIAANGRQVFYFTAQYNEVQKWEARAGERGIGITIIDLAEARDIAERERPPAVTLPLTKRTHTPHPGVQTRAEYRLTLAVPQLDLWSDDVGAAHLWYLIDDLNELHQLIDSHNVTTWGQVMNYGASGMATLGIDAVAFARLAACADALRALLARMQVGRGKPVTFADLQASGGLTSTFEKHCRDLLEEVNGDGKLFIQLLEAKRIGGFRVNQIDKFREYFEDNGHLVAGSPLTSDQIRPQMVRQCERAINAGEIDLATIDRLLDEAFPAGDSIVDLAHTVGVQASLLPSGE